MAAIQLATSCGDLYFSRCCALKRTGIFASESNVICLLLLNSRSDDFMFHSLVCVNNYFKIEKS